MSTLTVELYKELEKVVGAKQASLIFKVVENEVKEVEEKVEEKVQQKLVLERVKNKSELSTKEDIHRLEDNIHRLEDSVNKTKEDILRLENKMLEKFSSLFKWLIGIGITILLAILFKS